MTIRHQMFRSNSRPLDFRVALIAIDYARSYPSLGIATLAAHAWGVPEIRGAAEIHLLAGDLEEPDQLNELIEAIHHITPSVIALSCYVWNFRKMCDLARAVAGLPALVIAGGPEVASLRTTEALLEAGVDVVVRGEGEVPLRRLLLHQIRGEGLSDFLNSRGISSRGRNSIDVAEISDLGEGPLPYATGFAQATVMNLVPVELSRGCTRSCRYCYFRREGASLRRVPLDRVRAELDFLCRRGVRSVRLVDTDIGRSRNWLRRLLRVLSEFPLRYEADIGDRLLDPDECRAMSNSGIGMVEVGIQSTNSVALNLADRRQFLNHVAANVMNLQRVGIECCAQLIYGLPGDGLRGFSESLRTVRRMNFDAYDIFPLLGLPGTWFFDHGCSIGLRFETEPPHEVQESPGWRREDLDARGRITAGAAHLNRCENRRGACGREGETREPVGECAGCVVVGLGTLHHAGCAPAA